MQQNQIYYLVLSIVLFIIMFLIISDSQEEQFKVIPEFPYFNPKHYSVKERKYWDPVYMYPNDKNLYPVMPTVSQFDDGIPCDEPLNRSSYTIPTFAQELNYDINDNIYQFDN